MGLLDHHQAGRPVARCQSEPLGGGVGPGSSEGHADVVDSLPITVEQFQELWQGQKSRKKPAMVLLLLIYTCSAHAPAAETAGLIMHASGKQPWIRPERAQDTGNRQRCAACGGVAWIWVGLGLSRNQESITITESAKFGQ